MLQNRFNQPDEAAMERLLETHRDDPTGLVLCLAWREGLTRGEISALTWERVDFAAGLLRLVGREVPLEAAPPSACAGERPARHPDAPYPQADGRGAAKICKQSVKKQKILR